MKWMSQNLHKIKDASFFLVFGGNQEDKLMDRNQGILWIKLLLETIHVNTTVIVSWPLGTCPNSRHIIILEKTSLTL